MSTERRIIIVEDEALIAMDIQAELEAHGFDVAGVAGNLEQAAALLSHQDLALAVLDISLGRQKSYPFARACLEKGIEVIFMTGDASTPLPHGLQDQRVLVKPVAMPELIRVVAAQLGD